MNRKESMNNDKLHTILMLIAIVLMVLSFFVIYFKTPATIEKIDTVFHTDTFYKDTTLTVFIDKPVPKYIYVTKTDTVYDKEGNEIELKHENKLYQDTLCNKNDSIILKSYISGVNPTLDSIKADWRKSETIITNTVEITKYIKDKKLFHFGPTLSAGYDPINKQFGVMVGIGVNLDIK